MFFTEEAPAFPRELPLTIDFSTGFYFHREGPSLAFGGREQSLEELAPVAARRVPALEELGVRSSWWGYYELSPDHNALVGAAASPLGLLYATGFSGHGFQQGPVIGEHLAELTLGRAPSVRPRVVLSRAVRRRRRPGRAERRLAASRPLPSRWPSRSATGTSPSARASFLACLRSRFSRRACSFSRFAIVSGLRPAMG